MLISFVENSFHKIITDKLGVHVIEKLMICYDEELLKNIYHNILSNFTKLASDSNTLCLVRSFLLITLLD
jgi:uncharacterized protein YutD